MAPQKPIKLRLGIADIYRGDRSYLHRLSEDNLRRRGKFRELVLGQLAKGKEPKREDVSAALRETPPDAKRTAGVSPTDEQEYLTVLALPASERAVWKQANISSERWEQAFEERRAAIAADTAKLCEYAARAYARTESTQAGPTDR